MGVEATVHVMLERCDMMTLGDFNSKGESATHALFCSVLNRPQHTNEWFEHEYCAEN